MVAFKDPTEVDFRPTPSISVQAIEIEEALLGAILLDPDAFQEVESLPVQAFSISNHQQIFQVMRELHDSGNQPDLPTVAFRMSELDILKSAGGKSKLASLLDRTVHSASIKQYAQLLKEKYYRRYLTESLSRMARLAQTEVDLSSALKLAHEHLEKIHSVASGSITPGDTSNLDSARFSPTVTLVTRILEKGLPDWSEQAHLDALQVQSGLSKASFAHLVAAQRCQSDEVLPNDQQQLSQLIEWKNASLDYAKVLPHLAKDLLHDAEVLNIDAVMLWQYLLPTTLSLAGLKVDLDVNSHKVPAIAWTCSVAESGTGKSRAEGLILSTLKAWQSDEWKRFKAEWQQYKESSPKKGEENTEAVVAPVPERKFLFEVATIQAVMRRLSEQGENGSLWARDEIAGLFKSLSQFTAKGEGEGLECLLPMWDGTSAAVDRVLHEDSYYLASTRLSIAGGLQPGVFRKIFTDPDDAQGLQARFLFALPKVQPAKRVKGYCRLSEFLPQFYRWVDTQFPAGTLKLSLAADARYDAVYEDIGRQAEASETIAIRAWMRKLPGQLLRIAIALHIIECYYEPLRPRHEIQLDTLNRAVDFCRYYRSAFAVVQQSASDSDSISSILLKIWDMAATSREGLGVRDAYRSIKALSRRAKELGRNVAAYTIDLYYQLEKMGQGTVQRCGRVVRFVAGIANPPTTPNGGAPDVVTVVTDSSIPSPLAIEVSPISDLSPVTDHLSGRLGTDIVDIDVQNLSTHINFSRSSENLAAGSEPDTHPLADDQFGDTEREATVLWGSLDSDKQSGFDGYLSFSELSLGGMVTEIEEDVEGLQKILTDVASTHYRSTVTHHQPPQNRAGLVSQDFPSGNAPAPGTTIRTEPVGDGVRLLNESEMAAWHAQIEACQTLHEAMDFYTALDALSPQQRYQFESTVSEETWDSLWNLPEFFETVVTTEPELKPDQNAKEPTVSELKAPDCLTEVDESQ